MVHHFPQSVHWDFQFTIFKQPCVDIIRYIIIPYESKYLLRKCLGYDLEG